MKKKMRLSPPSKNGFIWRYILLVVGSGIIEECENQRRGRYLKKWSLTTALSDIQKPNPGKTFYLPVLTHIPPKSSIFLPTSVKIMLKNMNNQCLIVYYIQSTIKKGKQSQKSDIAELKQFEGKNCTWKCFPWVGFLYII